MPRCLIIDLSNYLHVLYTSMQLKLTCSKLIAYSSTLAILLGTKNI